jgi:hypothetical protein
MLELGIGADLVRGVGWVLWGLLALALLIALRTPRTPGRKAFWVLVVLGVFIAPFAPGMWAQYQYKQRYAKAKAVFDEVCKTAGDKIYKTVEGVEGITLLNVRNWREGDNVPTNAYAKDAAGELVSKDLYILQLLWWEAPVSHGSQFGQLRGFEPIANGKPPYRWVDVKQPDGGYLRYLPTLNKPAGSLEGQQPRIVQLAGPPSRYAVSIDNDLTPALREQWVAGTVVTITDTQTNEVLATRTRFKFEPGLGSRAGFRDPWSFAISCTETQRITTERRFVDQVLKPKEYQP